jgi:hypothetical protein
MIFFVQLLSLPFIQKVTEKQAGITIQQAIYPCYNSLERSRGMSRDMC